MRRALLIAILSILASCGRTRPAEDVSLAGTWDVELTRGVLPWARTTVRGQIQLTSAPDTDCDPVRFAEEPHAPVCESLVEGGYSIPLARLVNAHPYAGWTSDVQAMKWTDGTMNLVIGGCCDRGELVLSGRVEKDQIRGKWYQQFLNDGPRGRFTLRRVREAAPDSARTGR